MRALRLFLMLFLLLLPVAAFAQAASLSVSLTDRQGAPLPGAVVTLSDGQTATTDSTGNLRFESLPPGNYVVVVQLPGFASMSSTVTISAGGVGRVQMRLSPKAP